MGVSISDDECAWPPTIYRNRSNFESTCKMDLGFYMRVQSRNPTANGPLSASGPFKHAVVHESRCGEIKESGRTRINIWGSKNCKGTFIYTSNLSLKK